MHVRVPVDHYAAYEAVAAQAGMPLADWVALTLARSQDLPEPAYVHRSQRYEPAGAAVGSLSRSTPEQQKAPLKLGGDGGPLKDPVRRR